MENCKLLVLAPSRGADPGVCDNIYSNREELKR